MPALRGLTTLHPQTFKASHLIPKTLVSRSRVVCGGPDIVAVENALVLGDSCPHLIGALEDGAPALYQRKAGLRIYFARPLAGGRHASSIGCARRAGCRVDGELLLEVEAEGRD